MDPSTTLFTFMLETHPSVQTVSLVGSWDNFSKHYTMERDIRRDQGQWRGCYNFKDIICDGDQPGTSRRNGGLKMGQPYYFYYELDGSFETHDHSLPSTSACPYLPGQTVNMMWVPAEVSDRKRSASVSSVRRDDFKTMVPDDKFVTLRPPPCLPEFLGPNHRLPTSHMPTLKHKRSDRSLSPTPSWWSRRKIFARKNSTSSQGSADRPSDEGSATGSWSEDQRSSVSSSSSSEGNRPHHMSPESLRRFLLSDDIDLAPPETDHSDRLSLSIPDDIAEEEDDDFLASAISETMPKTILSPPPPMSRKDSSTSTNTLRQFSDNASVVTLKAVQDEELVSFRRRLPTTTFYQEDPLLVVDDEPTSRLSLSSDDNGSIFDDEIGPTSPSTDNDMPSFYHSDDEDDDTDCLSPPINFDADLSMGRESMEQSLAQAFEGYRLPCTSMDGKNQLAEDNSEASINTTPLLAIPTNSVVDEFVSELKEVGLNL